MQPVIIQHAKLGTIFAHAVPHGLGFDVIAYPDADCIRPCAHWQYNDSEKPDLCRIALRSAC